MIMTTQKKFNGIIIGLLLIAYMHSANGATLANVLPTAQTAKKFAFGFLLGALKRGGPILVSQIPAKHYQEKMLDPHRLHYGFSGGQLKAIIPTKTRAEFESLLALGRRRQEIRLSLDASKRYIDPLNKTTMLFDENCTVEKDAAGNVTKAEINLVEASATTPEEQILKPIPLLYRKGGNKGFEKGGTHTSHKLSGLDLRTKPDDSNPKGVCVELPYIKPHGWAPYITGDSPEGKADMPKFLVAWLALVEGYDKATTVKRPLTMTLFDASNNVTGHIHEGILTRRPVTPAL